MKKPNLPGMGIGRSRIGVYADEQSLCAVSVRQDLRGTRVERVVQIPLNTPAAAAEQTLKAAGLFRKKASLVLKGPETFLRYFEMPLLPKAEWKNAVRFEARKYAPFPIDEIECGFHVGADTAEKKLKVTFAGTRKESLDQALYALKPFGFEIDRVEPLAFSIVRAFSKDHSPAEECEVLIQACVSGRLNLIIIKGGVPLFTRHSQVEAPAAPASELDAFLPEIRLSLDYFSKYFKSERIARLVLCGSERLAWAETLTQELNTPVEVVESSAPSATGTDERLPAAAGAAMRALDWMREDTMNLISPGVEVASSKPAMAPAQEQALIKRAVIGGLVTALAFGLLFFFLSSSRRMHLRSEVARLTQAYPEGAAEDLALAEAEVMQKSVFLKHLIDDRVYWTEKMNEIARALPDGVWLTSVQYNDAESLENPQRSLVIEGGIVPSLVPDSVKIANRFVASLSDNKIFMSGFSETKLSYIRNENAGERVIARFQVTSRASPPQGSAP